MGFPHPLITHQGPATHSTALPPAHLDPVRNEHEHEQYASVFILTEVAVVRIPIIDIVMEHWVENVVEVHGLVANPGAVSTKVRLHRLESREERHLAYGLGCRRVGFTCT